MSRTPVVNTATDFGQRMDHTTPHMKPSSEMTEPEWRLHHANIHEPIAHMVFRHGFRIQPKSRDEAMRVHAEEHEKAGLQLLIFGIVLASRMDDASQRRRRPRRRPPPRE